MADGQLGHVVFLLAEADEVVVDAGLILAGVVKVEVFRLHVLFGQLLAFELGDVFEETLLVLQRHAPDHHGAIFKEEHLGGVDLRVEIGVGFSFGVGRLMAGFRTFSVLYSGISGLGG